MSEDESVESESETKDVRLPKSLMGLVLIVLIGGITIGFVASMFLNPNVNPTGNVPLASGTDLGSASEGEEAGIAKADLKAKASAYLNDVFSKLYSASVEINSVEDSEENERFYVIKFDVLQDGEVVQPDAEIYSTKDGRYLIPSFFDLDKPLELPKQTDDQQLQAQDIPKTDKPSVELFVMSFCPYGLMAEGIVQPAVELLGDKIEFEPHYVIYDNYCGYDSSKGKFISCKCEGGEPNSEGICPDNYHIEAPENRTAYCLDAENEIPAYCSMHGLGEVHEDMRQLVIWKYFKDKWWAYVTRINAKTDSKNVDAEWEAIASEVGIDTEKVKQYVEDEGIALLDEQIALMQEYNANGSPTYIINGMQNSPFSSSESFKQAICGAFTEAPTECSQELQSTGNPGNPSAEAGGCGA